MDEEMEDTNAVDFDYEFDAVRYFDLGRPESSEEAREAERWFEFACNYPPSPFASKQSTMMDLLKDNVTTLPKLKDELHMLDNSCNEFASSRTHDVFVLKSEEEDLRCPTLLRPIASQLAKQNKNPGIGSSRPHLPGLQKCSSVKTADVGQLEAICGGVQASKRQKLEGGHAQKVHHTQASVNLLRKCPQKKREPAALPYVCSRSKITIPRGPELRTAKRADRLSNKTQADCASRTIYTFKARPLNRKILEGPSLPPLRKTTPKLPEFQEFHLKTADRAAQHAMSSSMVRDNHAKPFPQNVAMTVKDSSQPCADMIKVQSNDGIYNDIMHSPSKFSAQAVNSKILSSREGIGVFRSNKREVVKQTEFDFATDKRPRPPQPPIQLFNKLTLETRDPQTSVSTIFSQPHDGFVRRRELKENVLCRNLRGKAARQKE